MRCSWLAAAVATAVLVLGDSAAAAPTREPADARSPFACSGKIQARALVAHISSGRSILCRQATVQGDLNLMRVGVVANIFSCVSCRFEGTLDLRHVAFEREIDVSGSTFEGDVSLDGAHFEESAIFGFTLTDQEPGAPEVTEFRGVVDLSFATFDDLAAFNGVHFVEPVDFSSARFFGVARFADARWDAGAHFPTTSFGRESTFAHAIFAERADFDGAAFGGRVDFRQASFATQGSFEEAAFDGRADFSEAQVPGQLSFAGARFGADALFRQVLVGQDNEALPALPEQLAAEPLLSFDHTSVGGTLNLTHAELYGVLQLTWLAAPSISLESAQFGSGSSILLADFTAGALSIRPAELKEYLSANPEQRLAALRVVEATAKANGDLGRANQAHFQLQVLESADDPLPQRIADVVFYRSVAGYFVQPLRPVVWLLGLIFVAAMLRAAANRDGKPAVAEKRKRTASDPDPPADGLGTVARAASRFVKRFALALAYSVMPGDTTPPLRRLELTVYAALLACFLLALANTNPTLRQMVDGLL